MDILVTGGAGFIGRWVVKRLLNLDHKVTVIDNLSSGRKENLEEFNNNQNLRFIIGDITNKELLNEIFSQKFDICIHLAAQIDIQESLEIPEKAVNVDILGTFYILEKLRKTNTKLIMMSTCMVYDMADTDKKIDEKHPTKPASPYAASKLSAEILALSYYYAYDLPVTIIRPFNTYGPFQKYDPNIKTEGSVITFFIYNNLKNNQLNIFGDGQQTRDFLYVEDCAEFIIKAAFTNNTSGEIINAGIGKDITITELANIIEPNRENIKYIEHHHPKSDVRKLICNYDKAKKLLNWEPKISLKEGIEKTKEWIKQQEDDKNN